MPIRIIWGKSEISRLRRLLRSMRFSRHMKTDEQSSALDLPKSVGNCSRVSYQRLVEGWNEGPPYVCLHIKIAFDRPSMTRGIGVACFRGCHK